MELTQEHVSKLETEFWGAENGGEQESQPNFLYSMFNLI